MSHNNLVIIKINMTKKVGLYEMGQLLGQGAFGM
jgi:hypothetical protein